MRPGGQLPPPGPASQSRLGRSACMRRRDIPTLIEYISEFMTLNPYDVILTGTPEGISHIHPGDELRLEIDGLGALESTVVAAE